MSGSPPTKAPPTKHKPKHHRLFLLSAPSLLALVLALAVLLATPTNPLPRFLRLLLGPKRSLLRPTAPGPVGNTTPDAGRPPCALWMAPFASGGGYCSEAWSHVASLDGHAAAGASANFTLASPVGDTTPDDGRPPCALWMAPFASGGGYCSEAWSHVASLDGHAAAGASANFTLASPVGASANFTHASPVGDTTPDDGRPPCVLWMAPFASGGGYCSEAWSYVASLDGHAAAGASANFTLAIAHHGDLESPEFWLGLPEESKGLAYRLATARCEPSRAVVVCHSEPGAWYPQSLPCPPTGYDEPAFVIGRTMFETDRVSPEHVRRCNQMDAVWVPTDFHVSTFVKSGVDSTKVVKVVQAVDVVFFDPAKHAALSLPIGVSVMAPDDSTLNPVNSKGKGFVFLSVFKWEQRKGWDVLLRAFLQEFSGADDVALYLLINAYRSDTEFRGKIRRFVKKSSIEEPVEGWAEVRMINEHVPQSALPRLYKAADAFVLPSRGEGWGRPVVEAMAMELPVIVTNWSGPTEYLTEENGYPLDVDRLTEVTDGPFKGHLCAEPSIDRLRGLMRRVFGDRAEARRKGKKAREDMIKRFSPAIVARIVADQIQQALAVLRRRITEM